MPTIDLRPATSDDFDFAFHVHCAAMREVVERTYGWDEEFQAQCFVDRFDPAEREIIRFNDRDVGVLSVETRDGHLFLRMIAILPAYQRRGIGTTIIRRLQSEARKRGIPVTLQVLKTNRARALYERLGFVPFAESETHIRMRWSWEQEAPPQRPGAQPV